MKILLVATNPVSCGTAAMKSAVVVQRILRGVCEDGARVCEEERVMLRPCTLQTDNGEYPQARNDQCAATHVVSRETERLLCFDVTQVGFECHPREHRALHAHHKL